jgi:hypothetical protein
MGTTHDGEDEDDDTIEDGIDDFVITKKNKIYEDDDDE